MPIIVTCKCGGKFPIQKEQRGKVVVCPDCGKRIRITDKRPPAAAPAKVPTKQQPVYDVFISHASEDKTTADVACRALEARGLTCWIAPRDILSGTSYGQGIIQGIENSRLMVLVFSSRANASVHVESEVERAFNKGKPVIPFRIEDISPSKNLEYFLSKSQSLDALPTPLGKHFEHLADTVQVLLETPDPEVNPPEKEDRGLAWLPASGAILGVLIISLALIWALLNNPVGRGESGVSKGSGGVAIGDRAGAGGSGESDDAKPNEEPGAADSTNEVATHSGTLPIDQPENQSTPNASTIPDRPDPPEQAKLDMSEESKDPITVSVAGPTGFEESGDVLGNRSASGRFAAVQRFGGNEASEKAVKDGLAWLARVQEKDGRWDSGLSDEDLKAGRPSTNDGAAPFDLGYTGLATLAFLGAGHTHRNGDYQDNVRNALDWIADRRDMESNLRPMPQQKFYGQGIATTALCDVCGMNPKDRRYRDAAQKAIEYVLSQMGPNGGYSYGGPGDDTHVTSFQIMAVKSAILAGFDVSKEKGDKLKGYLDRALHEDGTTGYKSEGLDRDNRAVAWGVRTACGLFCRMLLSYKRGDPDVVKIADLIDGVGPNIDSPLHVYNATYGMFQMGGNYWTRWNVKFRGPVVGLQVTEEGLLKGSWNPPIRHHMDDRRIITTALYIMALEVYYRFTPMNK